MSFFVLVDGTLAWLAHLFPVTLMVGGLWLCALIASARRRADRPRRLALWCVLPATLTLGVMVVGTVFAHYGGGPPPVYPQLLLTGLMVGHLPLAVVLSGRAGNHWPLVAASSAAWAWVSACACFVAVMAVTGEWL
jgi:hypothetical protein